MDIKVKLKRNKRSKKGELKDHKTYYDKERGVCLIDEDIIKQKLARRFKGSFV